MPQHLHLDFETFSAVDLNKVGAARYANDPSTEVLCMAMALGDEDPSLWYAGIEDVKIFHDGIERGLDLNYQKYWEALRNPEVLVYAHHAQFEMFILLALSMKTWGIPCPDLSRFRCTLSLARRACLPGKLEKLAETLELSNLKDKRGKALIKKFCEMQPAKKPTKKNPQGLPPRRIRPEDEPEAFAELCAYCQQDVRVEQEVARKLAYFDEPINNANYSLDAVINARGVPVNLSALRHAQKLIEEETEIVSEKFRELVGIEVTQGAKFLEWLVGEGYPLPNLQAETIEEFMEGWDDAVVIPPAVAALHMKQAIAYAAIKKVKTMLVCAGPHDNRIRGMLNHHGASTGRWTASLVQFQNMKRPTIKDSEGAYRMICEGVDRETLELCYGPVLEVISSCIRHFVMDCD